MQETLKQFDIAGRSAIVTGATSGLGLAFAETLAEAGAKVTVASINPELVDKTVATLRDKGWIVRGATVDVGNHEQVVRVIDDHVAEWGGPDAVFVNAGIGVGPGFLSGTGERIPEGQIDRFDLKFWDETIRVNLTGAFYTIREAARAINAADKPGSIVVTTSNASTITVPIVNASYLAAKAGLAHLVRQVALELAAYRIRVNAIAPGSVVSNIGGGILSDPAVRAVWDKSVPLGAMGNPEQMKALALYLASDASSFMTGAELLLDGGVALRSGF